MPFKNVFLVLNTILVLQSCCTKVDCTPIYSESEVVLLNFTAMDMDSVIVEIFENGSTIRIDSSLTAGSLKSGYNSTFSFFMNENIHANHTYKITIPGIMNSYILSDFQTKKEACNTCFLYHPKSDYYTVLNSYNMNGQKQENVPLQISK